MGIKFVVVDFSFFCFRFVLRWANSTFYRVALTLRLSEGHPAIAPFFSFFSIVLPLVICLHDRSVSPCQFFGALIAILSFICVTFSNLLLLCSGLSFFANLFLCLILSLLCSLFSPLSRLIPPYIDDVPPRFVLLYDYIPYQWLLG